MRILIVTFILSLSAKSQNKKNSRIDKSYKLYNKKHFDPSFEKRKKHQLKSFIFVDINQDINLMKVTKNKSLSISDGGSLVFNPTLKDIISDL